MISSAARRWRRSTRRPSGRRSPSRGTADDVMKAYQSLLEPGDPYKFIDLPISNYASSSYDKLVSEGRKDGGPARCSRATATTSGRCCRSAWWITMSKSDGTHAGLGRGKRRDEEGDRRTPQAAGSARGRQPGAVLEGCARNVRGRLAHGEEVAYGGTGISRRASARTRPSLRFDPKKSRPSRVNQSTHRR